MNILRKGMKHFNEKNLCETIFILIFYLKLDEQNGVIAG